MNRNPQPAGRKPEDELSATAGMVGEGALIRARLVEKEGRDSVCSPHSQQSETVEVEFEIGEYAKTPINSVNCVL